MFHPYIVDTSVVVFRLLLDVPLNQSRPPPGVSSLSISGSTRSRGASLFCRRSLHLLTPGSLVPTIASQLDVPSEVVGNPSVRAGTCCGICSVVLTCNSRCPVPSQAVCIVHMGIGKKLLRKQYPFFFFFWSKQNQRRCEHQRCRFEAGPFFEDDEDGPLSSTFSSSRSVGHSTHSFFRGREEPHV